MSGGASDSDAYDPPSTGAGGDLAVEMRDATFYWDDTHEQCALQSIDIKVARGSFAMVIGQVRS